MAFGDIQTACGCSSRGANLLTECRARTWHRYTGGQATGLMVGPNSAAHCSAPLYPGRHPAAAPRSAASPGRTTGRHSRCRRLRRRRPAPLLPSPPAAPPANAWRRPGGAGVPADRPASARPGEKRRCSWRRGGAPSASASASSACCRRPVSAGSAAEGG